MKHLLAIFAVIASPAAARTITVTPGGDAQEKLQGALIEAQPGDVVEIAAGRYALTDGLSLDVNRVTVRGAGPGKTILDFKGQLAAGEGLLVTSDDVVLRGFAVEDSKGDGIKSKGADRIVYKDVRVEWTGGPKETNGAYGVYPVESRDVLIDGAVVKGASDAGIYVGQSENIIVRNSAVSGNVAGIEIENSRHADVIHNLAEHNTGGILVFDLPNLPKMGGGDVRIVQNKVTNNDQPNFAPKGNIVASVRMGTGVLVMANDGVEVTENLLEGNATSNVMIVAYRNAFKDAKYNPLPRRIAVHTNKQGRAGFAPQLPGAAQLLAAFGDQLPPVLWDGTGEGIAVADGAVLNMNVALGAAMETAKPAPADLSKVARGPSRAAVVLPTAMEAAAR
ncbi:right-handed parallel beta-helix repeat-containing protein [Sphingomonas donggukensis]|uniref:Right-handed parallel beta-helix repeat-containing protein n=1 Tax=Sphingomonas donggukensis TaxID=2949093 RepID=A0ABY4TRL2_9SPHN|nr:parallel beta-helix domain-containing protein [Sphingomonas donggukensis]URW75030.1 right-handed parallel beta-helix repeat-containing protein [Sphingomonas donggukensis]